MRYTVQHLCNEKIQQLLTSGIGVAPTLAVTYGRGRKAWLKLKKKGAIVLPSTSVDLLSDKQIMNVLSSVERPRVNFSHIIKSRDGKFASVGSYTF